MNNLTTCEACKTELTTVVFDDLENKKPYHLCDACFHRLETFSLRPIEWYNLAIIHGPSSYHLHDDFYDDDGKACQAEEEVLAPSDYPAPSLSEVKLNLNDLIDYCLSKWFIYDEIIHAFNPFDKTEIFENIKNRYMLVHNDEIKERLIELASLTTKETCSAWLKEIWLTEHDQYLIGLSHAFSRSLSFEEAFSLITEELKTVNKSSLPQLAFQTLYPLNNPKIIDYIEYTVSEFSDNWGRLAAVSQLSWDHVLNWMNKGRPFSLIALEALKTIANTNDPLVREFKPKLINPIEIDAMTNVLKEYARMDDVPRVEKQINFIINNWNHIIWKRT